MRRSISVERGLAAAALVLVAGGAARAEGGPFGAGIILGDPSGLSLKLFLDGRHALDAAVDYSFLDNALYVHADYLLHFDAWVARGASRHLFIPYVGIGGKVGVHEGDKHGHGEGGLGVRVPLGVAWMPQAVPIDVFLEVVPGLFLLPATDPDLDASLGLRYFF